MFFFPKVDGGCVTLEKSHGQKCPKKYMLLSI